LRRFHGIIGIRTANARGWNFYQKPNYLKTCGDGPPSGLIDRLPNALGGQGHLQALDTERFERVADGVDDGRWRRDGACLADAFHAQRVVQALRDRRVPLDLRDVFGPRQGVVL